MDLVPQGSAFVVCPHHVVLDTNVVLDAWWFDDPATRELRTAIELGRLRWLITGAMIDEVNSVLHRPPFVESPNLCERVLSGIANHSVGMSPLPCATSLRCSDPDDQMFLDLAMAVRPCWLVSRDRAIVTLARRALDWSCRIVEPAGWSDHGHTAA